MSCVPALSGLVTGWSHRMRSPQHLYCTVQRIPSQMVYCMQCHLSSVHAADMDINSFLYMAVAAEDGSIERGDQAVVHCGSNSFLSVSLVRISVNTGSPHASLNPLTVAETQHWHANHQVCTVCQDVAQQQHKHCAHICLQQAWDTQRRAQRKKYLG